MVVNLLLVHGFLGCRPKFSKFWRGIVTVVNLIPVWGFVATEVHPEYDRTQGHPVAQLEHARHATSASENKSGGAAAAAT